MSKIKIPLDKFVSLRKKVKFLEHYWSLYSAKNDQDPFEYASTVEQFIASHFYEQIDGYKVNRFTKTVTLPQTSYDDLKKYAYISDELFALVNSK